MDSRLFCRLAAGLLALALAGAASADARGDLHAAFRKNLAAKTYRATMTDLASGKQVSVVEFQAPDRYRISVAGGPTTVIAGGVMYLDMQGQKMKVPVPKGMLENYRSDAALKQMQTDTVIRAAGAGTVGALPARRYRWTSTGKKTSVGDAWVDLKSGYVLQVESAADARSRAGAVRVRYSDFNSAAIRIAPP